MTKTLKELQEEHPEWFNLPQRNPADIFDQDPVTKAIMAAVKKANFPYTPSIGETEVIAREARKIAHSQFDLAEALIAAKREDEARIAGLDEAFDDLQQTAQDEHLKAMSQLTAEQQAHAETAYALIAFRNFFWKYAPEGVECSARLSAAYEAAIARQASINRPTDDPNSYLEKCPQCGGVADNGHDRCLPPNPYLCSKCTDDRGEGESK